MDFDGNGKIHSDNILFNNKMRCRIL